MRTVEAPPLPIAALHLAVLTSFAVAQPVFDLLGRNGEFFAVRGSTRWDVVVFALALAFVPPALLLAVEALTPRPARGVAHGVFVAGLAGLFVLEMIRDSRWPGWRLVALAAAIGGAAALLYVGAAAARLVLTVLGPAPLLFLGLFLLHSDASRLTLSGADEAFAAGARAQAPVVVVLFDELPLNSLLDKHRRVDSARFPHFAALARNSTWFANTSTVAEGTVHAVPALLTGRYPRTGELPVYHDHPQNLFTLLGGAADLHVVESDTHLCPPKLCGASRDSSGSRLGSLFADATVVYLHELLPEDLARGVPSVSNGWQDFWRNGGGSSGPERRFRGFLTTLRPARSPVLWYLHLELPHSPWRFLPSAESYDVRPPPGWNPAEVWTENQAAVDQYWQRHLLQLGFADRLLGELVARLRASDLYERSLLVVTADHGISFRAGEKRRPASDVNLQDIAYVPLFVKRPHQQRANVVRAPVQSIDVVPTLAAVLGIRIQWHVDGQNALSSGRRKPDVVLVKDGGERFVVPAGVLEARRERALDRQLRLFGSDEPSRTLFGIGRYRDLLGRPVRTLDLTAGGPAVRLDGIDRTGGLVQVSGTIAGGTTHDVAVVAGDKVLAVAPTAGGRFWALVPRAALGQLTPRVYAIERPATLRRLRQPT